MKVRPWRARAARGNPIVGVCAGGRPAESVVLPVPEPWVDEALCAQVDPELFFPEKGGSVRAAKQICQDCPVQRECLAAALERGERFGVWGGLSEHERRPLYRARRAAMAGERAA